MFKIDIQNLEARVAQLNRSAGSVDQATHAGIKAVAQLGKRQAEKQIGRIYKRKIPTRAQIAAYNLRQRNKGKRGKNRKTAIRQASDAPAWKRSGNLQKGVKALYPGLRTGIVDIAGNPAEKYAEPRHNLNKPGALGIVRHDPFFANTERIIEPQAPEVFENAFLNELDL